jgi:hypothetical protein
MEVGLEVQRFRSREMNSLPWSTRMVFGEADADAADDGAQGKRGGERRGRAVEAEEGDAG